MFGSYSIAIKIGAGVLICAIGIGIVWSYNHAIQRAITAENELKDTQKALVETKQSLVTMTNKKTELDKLLVEKQANENQARADAKKFENAFNLLREANKKVNFWAGAPLPINASTGELRK